MKRSVAALLSAITSIAVFVSACSGGTQPTPTPMPTPTPPPAPTPTPTTAPPTNPTEYGRAMAAALKALPSQEQACVSDALGAQLFQQALAGQQFQMPPDQQKKLTACLSESSAKALTLSIIESDGGVEFTPDEVACIDREIGTLQYKDALNSLPAEQPPVQLVRAVILCISSNQFNALSANSMLGPVSGITLTQLQCVFRNLPAELLQALTGGVTTPPPALLAVLQQCGLSIAPPSPPTPRSTPSGTPSSLPSAQQIQQFADMVLATGDQQLIAKIKQLLLAVQQTGSPPSSLLIEFATMLQARPDTNPDLLKAFGALMGVPQTSNGLPTGTRRLVGASMERTIRDGDTMAVDGTAYKDKGPQRGDIVVFVYNGQARVSRVIGLPGETLDIKDGAVAVNGIPFSEPYLPPGTRTQSTTQTFQVPADAYFVMGDNRASANDSRVIGPIARSQVTAKVLS